MGADFARLGECALTKLPSLDPSKVIYAGHSKGAYVASIAAGLAGTLLATGQPKAVLLFESAGFDAPSAVKIDPSVILTIVFSDQDTVVSGDFSKNLYAQAPCAKKQLIGLKSYPSGPTADHFWPLTQASLFGGTGKNALHFYGSCKWLTAAANDLADGNRADNPFVYGASTPDKGMPGLQDAVTKSW